MELNCASDLTPRLKWLFAAILADFRTIELEDKTVKTFSLRIRATFYPLERHIHTKSTGNQKNFIKVTTTKFQNKLDIKPWCHIAPLQMYEIPQLQKRRLS